MSKKEIKNYVHNLESYYDDINEIENDEIKNLFYSIINNESISDNDSNNDNNFESDPNEDVVNYKFFKDE